MKWLVSIFLPNLLLLFLLHTLPEPNIFVTSLFLFHSPWCDDDDDKSPNNRHTQYTLIMSHHKWLYPSHSSNVWLSPLNTHTHNATKYTKMTAIKKPLRLIRKVLLQWWWIDSNNFPSSPLSIKFPNQYHTKQINEQLTSTKVEGLWNRRTERQRVKDRNEYQLIHFSSDSDAKCVCLCLWCRIQTDSSINWSGMTY